MAVVETNDPRWYEFVARSADATAFHHPQWSLLLSAAWRYRAFVAVVTGPSGTIRAGVPLLEVGGLLGRRRWIALPFTDACDPLAEDSGARDLLISELDEARRDAGAAVEIRAAVSGAHHHRYNAGVIHRLGIGDADAVWRGISHPQHRTHVRRAQRSNLRVRHSTSGPDLRAFYHLHVRTRRRLGTPVQPWSFFRLLWRYVLATGLGFISIVEHEGHPIAAAVFLQWNGTLVFKYSASDQEHLRLRPNHLLLWDAFELCSRQGLHTFDFGRTDLDNAGLRQFKAAWGAREEPLIYTTLADRPSRRQRAGVARVLRPLIQRSPPWMCQALGEMLYRRAA